MRALSCSLHFSPLSSSQMRLPFFLANFPGFLFVLLIIEYVLASTPGNETDKFALLKFKSQISQDPAELLASWNETLHFCQWYGVICSHKHQRVTSLDLKAQGFSRTISPHVGNLSFLRIFNLADNFFHDEIPLQLGNLFRLQYLNLSFNLFEGKIPPNLSQCSNLRSLALSINYLRDQIPPELGSLAKLEKLYINNNNLTGAIPVSIGNLTTLQELSLSFNNLKGEIPRSVGQMKSLKVIGLSACKLSGEFPASLYNLSSIELISLSDNNFTGYLNDDIGLVFPNIQKLHLGGNSFIGPIPLSLSNASNLLQLDLPNNNFTGNVPKSLGNLQNLWWLSVFSNNLGSGPADDLGFLTSLINCSNLRVLNIDTNQFGGVMSSTISNLSTKMTRLLIAENRISGIIPEDISNLNNLNLLTLEQNLFTGSIPASIGKLRGLTGLGLAFNQLQGQIPYTIGNLTQLSYLTLEYNNLEGSIPSTLGNCLHLLMLDISGNSFNGTIPRQFLSLSSLTQVVNISFNSLSGSLPVETGNLGNLIALDFSHNRLSGQIPSTLGNCLSMEILYMQQNSFNGVIPFLGNLKSLQYMDLSNNNFSGQIPQYMVNLSSIIYLNLSFNNLEGAVPSEGVFENGSAFEVIGNAKLCGGIPELHLQPCPTQCHEKSEHHIVLKWILVTVSVASCSVLCLLLFVSFYFRKKLKMIPDSQSLSQKLNIKISYEELFNASGGFSSHNVVGSGSFGTVYKGVLRSGETVAIKVLNMQRQGALKSFLAECHAFKNIKHRNLVKVLKACSSMDFERNDFKALVYEFLPNGSLDEWLHPEQYTEIRSLDIHQRLNIAIDVAHAVNYLHHECPSLVIHCDLKPRNVLLDNDLTAHVSDFGLARILSRLNTETNPNQFSSLEIKGTVGYVAPEYGMGHYVSTEGDVYSYGILLLEIFTGRRPTDNLFEGQLNLHNYVKMALPNRVWEITDKTALQKEMRRHSTNMSDYKFDASSDYTDCMLSIFQIGIASSAESPHDRMNMRQVCTGLVQIRDKFLENGLNSEQI